MLIVYSGKTLKNIILTCKNKDIPKNVLIGWDKFYS